MQELIGKYVVVRTYSAGVHAGILASVDGETCTLTDTRRIWYWSGAASLSELSQLGVSDPNGCKFPAPIPSITLTEAIEYIPCSGLGEKSIREVPVWTRH